MFPIFIYIYFDMVRYGQQIVALKFWHNNSNPHKHEHGHTLDNIYNVIEPHHLDENPTAKLFLKNRYRVRMHQATRYYLLDFLATANQDVGTLLVSYVNNRLDLVLIPGVTMVIDRGEELLEDEGIPGYKNSRDNCLSSVNPGP
jgi:transcription initiation factor TFIID subunit 5